MWKIPQPLQQRFRAHTRLHSSSAIIIIMNTLITGVICAQRMLSLQKWMPFPGLDGLNSDGQTDQNRKQQKPAEHTAKI